MPTALRPLAAALLAGLASVAIAACGGSGAGLIPGADATTLEQDVVEVAHLAQAGNGSCQLTQAAIEKTEADLAALHDINPQLRARLGKGVSTLHNQALARCAQQTTTSTTTKTTSSATTTSAPSAPVTTTETSNTTEATHVTTSAPAEATHGGGTPAPEGGPEAGGPGEGGGGEAGGSDEHAAGQGVGR